VPLAREEKLIVERPSGRCSTKRAASMIRSAGSQGGIWGGEKGYRRSLSICDFLAASGEQLKQVTCNVLNSDARLFRGLGVIPSKDVKSGNNPILDLLKRDAPFKICSAELILITSVRSDGASGKATNTSIF
jgi:hypothetical protein